MPGTLYMSRMSQVYRDVTSDFLEIGLLYCMMALVTYTCLRDNVSNIILFSTQRQVLYFSFLVNIHNEIGSITDDHDDDYYY